jgi:hypothetical protein
MRVIPPIEITNAMLVESSVVEVAPAIYNAAASYPLAALVYVGDVGQELVLYRSLLANNAGHAPASSPAWWQNIGSTYAVYSAATTYAKGHRVIDPGAHLVYESQMDANTGQSLTSGTAWLKVAVTNRWASFDQLRNTQTVAPVDVVQSIEPGQRVSSIAVVGLDATSVSIRVTVAGEEVYAVTVLLSTRKSYGWRDYFFGEFGYRESVQFFNLPQYRNARITVTVRKAKGLRKVGGILVGNAVYIGDMQYQATSDHLNFSIVARDTFGNIELKPRRSVPKVSGQVWFDKGLTKRLITLREKLNGRPAVWSGLDDFTLDYFDPLFVYGVHKEFSLNLQGANHGIINLEVEEM